MFVDCLRLHFSSLSPLLLIIKWEMEYNCTKGQSLLDLYFVEHIFLNIMSTISNCNKVVLEG